MPELTDTAALASLFETHRLLNRAPALAWGVVTDGTLTSSGGQGADKHTVFRIASMTKSFTAACVLALRDEGVLALDDPIAAHAPELRAIAGPTADSPAVTIRHLLTMSSGIATDDAWADRHMDISDDALDALVEHGLTFAAAPGIAMEYSSLGYGVLGRVVLRATGTTVQEHARRRFFEPLGMTSTGWRPDELPPGTALAAGHEREGDGYIELAPCDDGAIAPMGGIFTTVADLARWVTFLADGYPPRDDPDDGPLARASRREMQQVARAFPPDQRAATDGVRRVVSGGYGMGLLVLHHEQLGTVVTHSGGLPGYGSNMRWVQGTCFGVIALANVTYARMADATAAALDLLAARGSVARPRVTVSDALRTAASALVALLRDWDDAKADALFTDNVFHDSPRDRRRAEATRLGVEHGPIVLERLEARTATDGVAIVRCGSATCRIEILLSAHRETRVQWYEVSAPVTGAGS
jgi:CubicO group peptidase (beta-lactamase class C family)